MNKKQNLLAIALSASFIIGGANVAQASDNTTAPVVEEEHISSEPASNDVNQNNPANPNSQTKDEKEEEEKQTSLTNNAKAEPAKLEIGQARTATAQGAGEAGSQAQKADDLNYGKDEKEIKDYSGSERYKETDLQPGDTNQVLGKTDENVEKDGFKFELKNPSATSPSKTEYGYQITIDKKTGQRTYTKIYVTDSGRTPVDKGDKSMMEEGDKLTPGSPDVTYKPTENSTMGGVRTQRNLNYVASEDTLKHINNKDNPSTSFGMKDNYTQDNPGIKFFGDSFALGYKVNPWPNENDQLQELKLNTNNYDPKKKFFVQGQDIDTGIKVDNVDENARERLVGQVYNPITGKVVPGASAYIGDDGNIHIKMPEGALKKDENGKTVINEDSIFNTPDFKALQNLDVKFFARPRTAEEFKTIAETPDDSGETGTYVETGAGTADINHKGSNITIDKQGIDRYDHYNLIGNFKLNLDDTRYYDQKFEDGNGDDTSKVTSSAVKPGEPFKVGIVDPEKPGGTGKSADEMNAADERGEASGKLIMDFINRENKGKAPEDQWKVDVDPKDISKFTITPPKSAKAGDFIAIPLEYTYTNGSKDVHWFHFVVQESSYIKPEYDAQVNFPVNEQTSPATVTEDGKRITPDHYSLPDTLETDETGNKIATDDKGNKWTVKVDEKTGQVSAKPVDPTAFNGGEKLTVPVVAHYVDEQKPNEDIKEEVNAYFVIEEKANMTARYNAKAGKSGDKLSSDVILNTEDHYNRRPGKFTIDSPTYTDDKGNTWNVSIDEKTGKVTATVPNAEEGKSVDGALLNVPVTAHYYEEDGKLEVGTKKTEAQFMAYGTNGKVVKTEEIPFETKVEKDPNLKKGEIKVITEGEKGSKKVTYTIEDSKITDTKEELKAPQERLIHVGEGVADGNHEIKESSEIAFETEIQFDDSLAPGETKVEQEGELGKKTRTTIINIQDGNVTSTVVGDYIVKKEPVKKIIKVGRNTEGKVEHKEELPFKYKVEEVDTLKKGEYKIVKPGKVGTKTTTWTIKNSKVEGDPTVTEVAAEDALIQVGKGTNDGTHEIVEKKNIDYKTVIEYDENLDAGQQEVVKEGNPGEQERTNTLVIKDGQVTETKEGEFKTTKEATDRVVKIGTKPVTKVVEKPFNTEYVYDENLQSGKTEEVTPGKNGKVTITTTYDKDQKKVVTSETEEAGQNRVVKIGGKTNGTEKVKEEIPFEVEVRKDPSLKKGEWKYATDDEGNELKGEKGEQEKTLTIVNSKVTETSEPSVTKKAKKAVILVGDEDFTGKIKSVDKDPIPFETEVTVDPSLKPGEIVEDQKGELGEQETELTREIKNGTAGEEVRGETKRTKEPVTRKIRVGAKSDGTHTYTNKKPFEVEVRVNPELKKGEHKVVQKGVEGEEEFTVTIENSKVTKTSEPKETKAPVKEIIEVGSDDFTGTFETKKTKAVEFETEYIVDETLEPGKTVVDKEGKLGEEEITVTHTIVNGKVTKSEESKPIQTKAPEKRIVRVGKKPSEGETTKTIEREIPYETKVIYDENLEAGFQKIENEGKPGKEEVTITQKIKDSKPVGEATETIKTITEKEDRVVRIGVKPVVKETELGNNTVYRHNPELKAGEEKVIEEGSKGSVKYTTTFNKETGKLEVKEERTEPKNKVVEYGSKTDGEFTYESEKAYDIIIKENPNLEAGKTKVIQEGKPGKTETTVKIENSKEVSRDTKTITEKQDKIIEIGTKNVCEIPPVDPKNPDPKNPDPKNPDPKNPDPKNPDPKNPDPKNPDPKNPDPKNPDPENPDPKDPQPEGPKNPKDPKPNEPGTPGEKPNKPNEPGTPGETPNRPNEPGKPGKPGEDPKTPESPKENPKTEEKGEVSTPVADEKLAKKENKSTNPKTGIGSVAPIVTSMGISIAGLLATKKKKKED
ncbi:G5 domain-containing protein [Anaerococcus sp. NML200574]|uniref:G5 domain-containing protein n=1 Tax=Anaerococcus sp. NML200574 TaxID=2954486 RepID=UPI0022388193|nr:G5 domain-containing protein [Anaerococcus sp. NML200574]MCW6678333.1 G5 domain-containing protein [Anaerococcus sp. NML200574]